MKGDRTWSSTRQLPAVLLRCLLVCRLSAAASAAWPDLIRCTPPSPLSQMRWLLLWLLAIFCARSAGSADVSQVLAPFDYINGQLIDLDTGIKSYKLTDLKSNTGYEVRVSFPASVSTCQDTVSSSSLSWSSSPRRKCTALHQKMGGQPAARNSILWSHAVTGTVWWRSTATATGGGGVEPAL